MADITLEQFQKEALAWLEANAERRPVEKAFVWGKGSDNFYREKDRAEEAKNAEAAKEWRQKKVDAGFGWIGGPKELGGRGERLVAHARERPVRLEAHHRGGETWFLFDCNGLSHARRG